MCGRYALSQESAGLAKYFGEASPTGYRGPSYNVAPSQYAPVVTVEGLTQMKWGLIPQWAKNEKVGYSMINAVGETVFEKRTYKAPIVTQRCLVPASGFYEWLDTPDGKQPYYFTISDRPLFTFAGLFVERLDSEGQLLKTFTILTTAANALVAPIHDRMPVILTQAEESDWLDADMIEPERIAAFIDPYPPEAMEVHAVGREVGNAHNNGPQLIRPLD
jgi:putative SOS response-associated peptidase YedK